MLSTLKSCARRFGVLGAGLLLAAALPALAQTEASAVDTSAGLTVARDAVTGKLRPLTAAEASALQKKPRSVSRVKQHPMPRVAANGARGARLTDDFMSYSVVVRKADGSLATAEFDNRAQAEAAAKGGAATAAVKAANTLPTE